MTALSVRLLGLCSLLTLGACGAPFPSLQEQPAGYQHPTYGYVLAHRSGGTGLLAPEWQPSVSEVDTALATAPFAECGATQPRAIGWVSPRGEDHGALVEAIDGQWLLQLMVESKLVPGSVVKRQVETLAAQIEKTTGRKPGKKERGELKDQATQELLPMAFTKTGALQLWLDLEQRALCVDAGSAKAADAAPRPRHTPLALHQQWQLPPLSADLGGHRLGQ